MKREPQSLTVYLRHAAHRREGAGAGRTLASPTRTASDAQISIDVHNSISQRRQGKLVDAILPGGLLSASNSTLIQ